MENKGNNTVIKIYGERHSYCSGHYTRSEQWHEDSCGNYCVFCFSRQLSHPEVLALSKYMDSLNQCPSVRELLSESGYCVGVNRGLEEYDDSVELLDMESCLKFINEEQDMFILIQGEKTECIYSWDYCNALLNQHLVPFILVPFIQEGLYGYRGSVDQIVYIRPSYTYASSFYNKSPNARRWIYSFPDSRCPTHAIVRENGNYYMIDPTGKEIAQLSEVYVKVSNAAERYRPIKPELIDEALVALNDISITSINELFYYLAVLNLLYAAKLRDKVQYIKSKTKTVVDYIAANNMNDDVTVCYYEERPWKRCLNIKLFDVEFQFINIGETDFLKSISTNERQVSWSTIFISRAMAEDVYLIGRELLQNTGRGTKIIDNIR